MDRLYSFLIAFFCSIVPLTVQAESLADVAGEFQHAQFLDDNAMALKFRLALLDHAAAGAQVRITSFTYDAGTATQVLKAHICSAEARGVNVELIVDSKSGGVLGQGNLYNDSATIKQNEQDYQELAACGVQIYVHNFSTDFVNVSLLGKRLPNIFDGGVKAGDTVNPFTFYNRFKTLRQRFLDGMQPALRKNGLNVDMSNLLANIQALLLNLNQLQSRAGENPDGPSAAVEEAIGVLSRAYQGILTDPFWTQFDRINPEQAIAKLKSINDAMVKLLATDPVLKSVRDKIRVFNRLNHRKLFLVEEPSGESCVIVGGRNLGDFYLTDGKDSYRDGDVFFCKRHVASGDNFFTEANASLDQLKSDTSDPALVGTGKTVVKLVTATKHVAGAPVAAISQTDLKGHDLGEIANPILLTSSWDPAADGVRRAMLEAILRERKEIYIESAYAEFNHSMREALQKALARGVQVRIVTNGLFISDAGSKLIRPWMAKWNEAMATKYPSLFEIDYAPLSAGHMIHFKGAAFRCQEGVGEAYYRQYIVGSHNFHPRSGYSDKEHAIEWRVPTDSSCPAPESDLITLRGEYYQQQRQQLGSPVLRKYTSLLEEVEEVTAMYNDPKDADIARAVERVMYINGELIMPEKLEWIEELLDSSGLRDLVGTLL